MEATTIIDRRADYGLFSSVLRDLASKFLALALAWLSLQLMVFIFKRRKAHRTFERMQVAGPKPHFIHGHLYETRRQPYIKFAHKMHEKFGKTVGVYLGGDPYLMTKDLDLIQQVFVAKSRLFYNRMNFYLNVDPVPDNLICQRGDRWRYMRKLLTPAFSNSKIKSSIQFYRDTQKTVSKFMQQLEENSSAATVITRADCYLPKPLNGADKSKSKNSADNNNNKPQAVEEDNKIGSRETFVEDSYDRMAAVALDVIVKTAFHMDNVISFAGPLSLVGSMQKHGKLATLPQDTFLEAVKRASRLAFNPLVELIFCFPFLDVPLTFLCNQLYLGSIIRLLFDRLDYLVRRSKGPAANDCALISSAQPETKTGSVNKTTSQKRRIIDSLIEVLRDKKITRSEFTGNAFVIVFAGFETTANALTFTLWLLAKHQNVQQKLRRELRSQMERVRKSSSPLSLSSSSSSSSPPSDDKQANDEDNDVELAELATGCEYLEMVLNESLRLYPPVPGLSCRQASQDCQLTDGLKLEKGVNVIPSVFSIHRDKAIWGDSANEFRPERFEMLDVAKLNSAMFMPFGLGPRNCIGKALAMHEMKIVIGRLILEYSVEFCPGKTPEKLKLCSPINITITSADKIGLKFVKLNNSTEAH